MLPADVSLVITLRRDQAGLFARQIITTEGRLYVRISKHVISEQHLACHGAKETRERPGKIFEVGRRFVQINE